MAYTLCAICSCYLRFTNESLVCVAEHELLRSPSISAICAPMARARMTLVDVVHTMCVTPNQCSAKQQLQRGKVNRRTKRTENNTKPCEVTQRHREKIGKKFSETPKNGAPT